MFRLKFAQLRGVYHIRHRTPRRRVGNEHRLLWIQNRGSFRHKVDPAENNDIRLNLGGAAGEFQRVAREVRCVLHFAALVVMCENYRVPFIF